MLATSVCSFIPVTELMAVTKFVEANTSRGFEAHLVPAPIYSAIALANEMWDWRAWVGVCSLRSMQPRPSHSVEAWDDRISRTA